MVSVHQTAADHIKIIAVLLVVCVTTLWRMRMVMYPQIDLPVKPSSADLAREGFESHVLSAVCNEIGRLAKAFATMSTFVWFLTRVYQCMLFHVRLLMKAFTAILARKRPDICVDQHVRGES